MQEKQDLPREIWNLQNNSTRKQKRNNRTPANEMPSLITSVPSGADVGSRSELRAGATGRTAQETNIRKLTGIQEQEQETESTQEENGQVQSGVTSCGNMVSASVSLRNDHAKGGPLSQEVSVMRNSRQILSNYNNQNQDINSGTREDDTSDDEREVDDWLGRVPPAPSKSKDKDREERVLPDVINQFRERAPKRHRGRLNLDTSSSGYDTFQSGKDMERQHEQTMRMDQYN